MKRIVTYACALVLAPSLWAEVVNFKGAGEAPIKNPTGKVSEDEKEDATQNAIYAAVDNSIEQQDPTTRAAFNANGRAAGVQKLMGKGIVTLKGDPTVNTIPAAKKVKVTVTVAIDLEEFGRELRKLAVKSEGTDNPLSNLRGVVFFSAIKTTQTFRSDGREVGEEKELNAGAAEGEDAGVRRRMTAKETGVVQKADEQKFALDVQSSEALGAGVLDVLLADGFNKFKDGSQYECSQKINEVYGAGKGMTPAVLRAVVDEMGSKKTKPDYVVIARMEFFQSTTDDMSSGKAITARVMGNVYQFDEDGELDSVGAILVTPKQFSGKTEQIAMAAVLDHMSKNSTTQIIQKLANKNALMKKLR